MKNLTYGVLKTYSGLLRKTHIGNAQVLILPLSKTFMVFNLIGAMANGKSASQLILRMGIEMLPAFMKHYQEKEHFTPLEILPCLVKQTSKESYEVSFKKPGRHVKSNLSISLDYEHSTGDVRVYMIDGKFNLVKDENLANATQMKMVAQRNKAQVDGLLRTFLSKFMG